MTTAGQDTRGIQRRPAQRLLPILVLTVVSCTARIVHLLGPANCYVAYGDEPCYVVTLDRPRYQLEFRLNHSDAPGTVTSVWLTHF
jgi:hypothetical protein